MSGRMRASAAILVLLLLAKNGAFWYFALRATSAPTASLQALLSATSGVPSRAESADGAWKVQPGASVFVGYRVGETLLPAGTRRTVSGRSTAVDGTMSIEGSTVTAARVAADVTKLTSDESLRDKILESQALETAKYTRAVFTLSEPLTLPPSPAKGAEVPVTAKGTLEAHGVTRPFQLPLMATWNGDEVTVATVG